MSRITQCAQLVRNGLTPGRIQSELGVTQISVNGYLDRAVGEGLIRRADIFLNIIDTFGAAGLDPLGPKPNNAPDNIRSDDIVFLGLLNDTIYYVERDGINQLRLELYSILSGFEARLHPLVSRALAAHFTTPPEAWWEQGVPPKVRRACERLRELDKDPQAHPFGFTSFTHLGQIIDSRWEVLEQCLPKKCASRRQAIVDGLDRLKLMRNRLAHPTRVFLPTRSDFELAEKFSADLAAANWRLSGKVS